MKHFIDLGCYVGDTINIALKVYKDFDSYVGFEPVPEAFKIARDKFKTNKRVSVRNEAASVSNGTHRLYLGCMHPKRKIIGKGSTLYLSKTSAGISRDNAIDVQTIDFSQYMIGNYNIDDYIVLKIDIEGAEYDLLEYMVATGAIKYVDELYCEWHAHKMSNISKKRHDKLIGALCGLGFKLKGEPTSDEFSKIVVLPRGT